MNNHRLLAFEAKWPVLSIGVLIFVTIRLLIWIQFDFAADFAKGDSEYYLDVARNILISETHISSTGEYAYRAPAYPYFISILFNLGVSSTAKNFYFVQSSLLLLVYVFVFFLVGKRSRTLANKTFIVLCIFPFDAIYNGRVLAENLLSPLVLLALTLLMFRAKKYILGYILPGILLGMLTLTKDVFLLLPFFVAFYIYNRDRKFNYVFILLLSYSMTIAPWIARNATLENDNFFSISKGIMWSNLWYGAWVRDDIRLSSAIEQGVIDESQLIYFEKKIKNKENEQWFFREEAISLLLDRPAQVIANWIYRIPKMWIGTRTDLFTMHAKTRSTYWYVFKLAYFSVNLFCLLLFFLTLAVNLNKRDLDSRLFGVFIFYVLFIYVPFYNIETRYSQPVISIMLLYLVLSKEVLAGFWVRLKKMSGP